MLTGCFIPEERLWKSAQFLQLVTLMFPLLHLTTFPLISKSACDRPQLRYHFETPLSEDPEELDDPELPTQSHPDPIQIYNLVFYVKIVEVIDDNSYKDWLSTKVKKFNLFLYSHMYTIFCHHFQMTRPFCHFDMKRYIWPCPFCMLSCPS